MYNTVYKCDFKSYLVNGNVLSTQIPINHLNSEKLFNAHASISFWPFSAVLGSMMQSMLHCLSPDISVSQSHNSYIFNVYTNEINSFDINNNSDIAAMNSVWQNVE